MNIIFGADLAQQAEDKYTVLELDTFVMQPNSQRTTAYCLVEMVPLQEMPGLASMQALHQNLMTEYRKRNWKYCEDAIEHLQGKWRTELDTFYIDLHQRIQQHKTVELDADWDGAIVKLSHSVSM